MQIPLASCFRPASRNRNPFLRLVQAISLLFVLTLTTLTANAQSTQGSILGTAKDSTGAIVPGATVTLTNTDTGIVRTTTSSSSGEYQFLDLVPGRYDLVVTASGFQSWKLSGAQLEARQQLRADAALVIGGVQQTVQVSGDNASAIETETPSINAVYSADDAVNLPTNSRAGSGGTSGLSLIGTLPGVQTDSGSFSLQGALPYQTQVSIDGITVQSATGNSPIKDAFPSTDAISEIRADGVLNNAEFGDPGSVVITSKGGSNKVHGSAYWYHQNAAFDSIDFGASSKPHKVGNTFGGRFSGPVVLPKLYDGHDKLFIYGGYEGYRFPQSSAEQYVVPTTAMTGGDFSNYSSTGFTGLTDPYTGGSYGTTLTGISSISQQFLQFFPAPNHVATANGVAVPTTSYVNGETANYYVNQDSSQHSDQFDIRPDKYFGANQKFLLWGRYSYKNYPSNAPQPLAVPSSQDSNVNHQLVTSFNWTVTPTLINEFRFGFTLAKTGDTNSFNGKAFTEGLGLTGLQNLFYNGIPELDFSNLSSLTADRLNSITDSKTYQYTDNLSWSKGRHNFKFGLDIQSLEALTPLGFNGSDNYGTFGFSNTGAGVGMYTGVDFADFLLGIPNNTFYDVVQQDNDGKSTHYAFYAQDEWKATDRLTLSYGIRYELHPGYSDAHGDIGNFDPNVALSGEAIYPDGKESLLAQNFLSSANACDPDGVNNTNSSVVNGAPCMPVLGNSAAGFPAGLKHYPKKRFMPRFGFAYRPFNDQGKTVVRGGFGMYNITILGSTFYSLTGTLQAQTSEYVNTYNSGTHAIGYQWPTIYAGAGNGGCADCYGTSYFGTANSVNWKDPYTEQWALSVDHDFGGGYAARVSYIGSETHQLEWAPDENTLPFSSTTSAYDQPQSARLFPNWGRINTRATGANESYHSLQLDASHRFQHGLQFDSAFTWAKALADNQGPDNSSFAGETGGARSSSILDRHADFGNVAGTRRLLWNTTGLYDLPIGRGRMIGANMPRILDTIIGGWRISNILSWQTGDYLTPEFPSSQGDPSGTGSGLTASADGWDPGHRDQHPDNVIGVSYKPAHQNRNQWVNSAAFTCPGDPNWAAGNACATGNSGATVKYNGTTYVGYEVINGVLYKVPNPIGRFGNTQVGSVEGPHYINLNSGIVKTFAIYGRFNLRAEGTFTNVLNHTNLSSPDMDLSSASFGTITSGVAGRVGQVSMRLEF